MAALILGYAVLGDLVTLRAGVFGPLGNRAPV
jgi:hypothetical protein